MAGLLEPTQRLDVIQRKEDLAVEMQRNEGKLDSHVMQLTERPRILHEKESMIHIVALSSCKSACGCFKKSETVDPFRLKLRRSRKCDSMVYQAGLDEESKGMTQGYRCTFRKCLKR